METHKVCGMTKDGKRVALPIVYSWAEAQRVWNMYDRLRRAGKLPGMAWVAVRASADPDWVHASTSLVPWAVLEGNGFSGGQGVYTARQRAARKAWRLYTGGRFDHPRWGAGQGEQGLGGWFRWPNGRVAAQGLGGLADVCERLGMIRQHEGVWYTTDLARGSVRSDTAAA